MVKVILLEGPSEPKRRLLNRRQAHLFREQVSHNIILDAFHLTGYDIEPEVRDLISDELTFVVCTLISGYTLQLLERVPPNFEVGSSRAGYFERYSRTEAENQWSHNTLDRCRQIRERVNFLFSFKRELMRADCNVLDRVTTICPPTEKDDRKRRSKHLHYSIFKPYNGVIVRIYSILYSLHSDRPYLALYVEGGDFVVNDRTLPVIALKWPGA